MGRLELEFPVSSGLKSLGLRPSAFVDAGSLWHVKQPALLDIVNICTPLATTTGLTQKFQGPGDPACDPTMYSRCAGIQGILPRQFRQAAPVGRHRRQLGFAIRAASDRYREGAPPPKGGRYKILQLQRRNSILMKNFFFPLRLPLRRSCPRRPKHRRFQAPSLRSSTSTGSPASAPRARPPRPRCAARQPVSRTTGRRLPLRSRPRASRSRPRSTRCRARSPTPPFRLVLKRLPDQAAAG